MATRLARRWWAANIAASHSAPSLHSASLISTTARRGEPCKRAASAAPAATESPCPSDPDEKSIPLAGHRSGCTPRKVPSAQ